MGFDQFVAIDPATIRAIEYGVFLTHHDDNFGFDILFEVESEDEDNGITGLDHLRNAIIAVQVYRALSGARWRNIKEIVYGEDKCGALVEFNSRSDAVLFKLSQP